MYELPIPANPFDLTGLKPGQCFLGCRKCGFQHPPDIATRPECPNCHADMNLFAVKEEGISYNPAFIESIKAIHAKMYPPEPLDANVEAVRRKLSERAAVGLRKYGVTTERTDWTRLDRLRHALEEACDLAVYLQSEISIAEKEENRSNPS